MRFLQKYFRFAATGSLPGSCSITSKRRMVDCIRAAIVQSQRKSTRTASVVQGVLEHCWRSLLKRCNIKPYKVQLLQVLSEEDKVTRVAFCEDFIYWVGRSLVLPRHLLRYSWHAQWTHVNMKCFCTCLKLCYCCYCFVLLNIADCYHLNHSETLCIQV